MNAFTLSLCSLLFIAGCNASHSEPQNNEETASNQQSSSESRAVAPAKLQTKAAARHDVGHSKPSPADKVHKAEPIAHIDKDAITEAGLKNQRAYLKFMTKDKECDTTTQCQVLPVGSRACGGPSDYVIFSTKTADPNKVKELADQLTHAEATYNAKNKMISICQHLAAPATQCVNNKCVKLEHSNQATY
ncbi:hypothetical protein [Pseudoalteromonas sp. OOF1S-7]|uniref:hypothetical protein n=1 Tax=Pseudoalteromonas sp. OOF1S-7 TaxID=2917757 RepID=UPI001EF70B1D|nr:hypothetical protein [Pseudoalteromonas sp. OOF1S-7]MCG7537437.1 hypothetical protein [Pseudoalteromonas sp. OOF1S-7]